MTSIILPTCFRLEALKKSFDRFYTTTKHLSVEFIIVVDEDEKTAAWVKDNTPGILLYRPTMLGSTTAWNDGLRQTTHNIIFPAGDDSYAEDNWLDIALESHHEKLNDYGMIGLNDMMFDGNFLCTTPVCNRTFIKEVLGGVIFCPKYLKYGVDNEAHERAVLSGRYYWESRAVVRHVPEMVKSDDVIRVKFPQNRTDAGILGERRQLGFPNDFEPVI